MSIIPERWYQDAYQGMNLSQECGLLFAYEKENIEIDDSSSMILSMRKSITVSKTVPIVKKTIEQRTKYGKL